MKIKLDTDVDPRDLPALNISLYHASKKNLAEGYEPQNEVERNVLERANKVFSTYLTGLRSEFLDILEKDND